MSWLTAIVGDTTMVLVEDGDSLVPWRSDTGDSCLVQFQGNGEVMMNLDIPSNPEEITPEWLTLALREAGTITTATVSSVSIDTTVTGHGFAGQIVLVDVTYNFPEKNAPSSLIAKFPPSYPQTRALLGRFDRLGREIRFYQEIAADVGISTPRCYYGGMNLEAGRYILLLENLSPALVGDQIAGCSFEDAELAILHLAKFHAVWWDNPKLDKLDWAPLWNVDERMVETTYNQSWRSFLGLLGDRLTPSLIDIGERLGRNPNYARNQLAQSPRTLVHGDYRLDNLFFATDGDVAPIAAVDWDICRRGRGVYDAAYFITGSLHPEQRKRKEADFLRIYHSVLVENGVSNYSFEQCQYDYRLAMLDIFLFFIQALPAFNFESERGEAHLDLLLQRQFTAITDLNCGELLSA